MHALFEDGAVAATVVLAMVEVAIFATGGMGWEDAVFVATGVLNFNMSSLLIVCFFFFTGTGIGASSLWLDVCVGFGLGLIRSGALDMHGVAPSSFLFLFSLLPLDTCIFPLVT